MPHVLTLTSKKTVSALRTLRLFAGQASGREALQLYRPPWLQKAMPYSFSAWGEATKKLMKEIKIGDVVESKSPTSAWVSLTHRPDGRGP